jgi:hypothetical protein
MIIFNDKVQGSDLRIRIDVKFKSSDWVYG